jgi:tryptophan 2,3-dioxygenase
MSEDPAEGAHLDLEDRLTYGRYLALDELLSLQRPLSDSADEMLFIVIHQASELWLKLMVHELRLARSRLVADDPRGAFKITARVSRIQAQLAQSWDVLATLTPTDYLDFRHLLGPASGFQSHQYRLVEFLLGNKSRAMLAPHRHTKEIHEELERELEGPSLYDEALALLARRGFDIDPGHLARDRSGRYEPHPSVVAAWAEIYRDSRRHWDLYELGEELVDLEDGFRQWRFRHVTTVERIIGHKRGTGGTAGVSYLKRTLDIVLFPELWALRTEL